MGILTSSTLQSYCKWASSPKIQKRIDNYAPPIQSIVITGIYVKDILDSKLPEKNKRTMAIHDIACGIAGVIMSLTINNLVDKLKNNVVKNLQKAKIKDIEKICGGVKIAVPIIITSSIFRYINPCVAVPLAEWVDKKYEKDKKKIDLKA